MVAERGRGRGSRSVTRDYVNDRSLPKIGRRLGECRAGYSAVYEGNFNGNPVVVEKMHSGFLLLDRETEAPESQRIALLFSQRANLLKQLSHPHIAKILEVYESKEEGPVIVMERLDLSLRQHLEQDKGKLSRERQIDISLQIADAVRYLHSQQPPVVYRNLSSTTVRLNSQDGVVKLCTTAEAARLPPSGYFDTYEGAFEYMPPETQVGNAHYNEKIDIYSFGVLMLEIAIQRLRSRQLFARYGTIDINRHSEDLSLLPEDHPLKPIILQCLRDDPGERPDSGTVFRMLSKECSMRTACGCDCKLFEHRVTAIEASVRSHKDNVKKILDEQLEQVKDKLATVQDSLALCEDTLQAKDQQNEELQQTIANLREEQLQRENEFTTRLSAIEAQVRALQPPWVIPEAELEVTETVLGKGAYGEVRVGVYHGTRVAVKRLHDIIASDYYHKMIQREMGIAARLRHPKLVLFIGAVTRGNLTIVTELMETSLRSELEHGRLKEADILPISQDVACALCYLHSLPEPIIHRDVSSANVLLNSRQGGWTAKVGDYGSANFQTKLQTVGPGCFAYAAPEASRPEEQGPKMDVYSYGVLLLEMCTGTLPNPHDLPIIQQEVRTWEQRKRRLGELACQCTLQSSDRRPHMRTVVTQLDGM